MENSKHRVQETGISGMKKHSIFPPETTKYY